MIALLLSTAATIGGPLVAKQAIDEGIVPGDESSLQMWVVVFVVVAGIGWAASAAQSYLTSWVGERILTDLRVDLFEHVQRLDLGFFERTRAGVVISRLTNDVEALETLVTDGPTTLLQNTVTLIGSALVLLYLDWQLALATLTVFPGMAIATALFRRYSSRAYRRTRERLAEVTASLQEDISGVRVVQAFRRERANERRFHEVNGSYREANVQTVNVSAVYFPVVDLLSATAMAVVLGYGGVLVINGQITTGDLFVFIGLLSYFFEPVQQLSQFYQTFLAGTAALDKIFDVLDTDPRLTDRPDAKELPQITGRVEFEDVRFAYREGSAEVLHGISFAVQPGQTVALVGHTGAGKSTIVKLLARFYDPTGGRVPVDGHDLRDVTMTSLRRQLGMVPQEGFLFARSVRENIAFGRPDASREEVEAAARAVGAARVHRGAARGLRHLDRRARRPALDRPAPAGRVRPRAAGRPAAADPGRGDLERRHPDRGADRAGAGDAARRPHGVRGGAPALDDPPRRPDRRARVRRDHRVRHPRAADRREGAVLRALRRLGRRGRIADPQEIPANARYQGSAGAETRDLRERRRAVLACGRGRRPGVRAADRRLDVVLGA